MREMKDSGLQWAGDIPQYWNIAKRKALHGSFRTSR